jgi:polyisoprenoid-binding protein YceI
MSITKWVIDSVHSEIQFKVKHLLISTVTGQFNKFESTIEMEDEDIQTAKAYFSADVNSISTNNEQRDSHLRSSDFFDAENHSRLTFETERIEKVDHENFKVHGILTMRGVSKPIVLDAELGGIANDPRGNRRIGISLSGKVNRQDFGVSFSMLMDTGGLALSDEIKIAINAEFVKQVVVR